MMRLANRSPAEIVTHHIEAVQSMDPIAMAADYALDAILQRDHVRHGDGRPLLSTLIPYPSVWWGAPSPSNR